MNGKIAALLGNLLDNRLGRRALLGRIVSGGALAGAAAAGLTSRAATAADIGPNMTLDQAGIAFANITLSVSDMERSTGFYQALGFEVGDSRQLPPPLAKLLETSEGFKGQFRFLRRDGLVLELVRFELPSLKKASDGASHQLGLAHIALRVDDVDRVATLIKKNGGGIVEATRTKLGPPGKGTHIVFCTDPDGTRIEVAGPLKA